MMKNTQDRTYVFNIQNVKIIDRSGEDYFILTKPENGAWTTIANEKLSIIKNIIEYGATSLDFKTKYSTEKKLFKLLFEKGILSINNEDRIMKNWYECQALSEDVYPSEVILKYTKKCNLQCSYCYVFSGQQQDNNCSMNNDTVLYILKKLINDYGDNVYNVSIHGGEPLLRYKDMEPLVREVSKISKKIHFSLQTNGTLITKEIATFFKDYDIGVGVSLDGMSEETNTHRRDANGNNSFRKTIEGIDILLSEGISPGILSVITPENQYQLLDFYDFLINRGVKKFGYNYFIPSGRGKDNDHLINIDRFVETNLKLLLKINDLNSISHRMEDMITIREIGVIMHNLISWKRTNKCAISPCSAGQRLMGFDADGTIYSCDDFIHNKDFCYGNIFEINNLKDVARSSPVTQRLLNHNIKNIEECSICEWRKICPSHCAADSYFFNNKLNSPHSQCAYFKKLIPAIIDLIHNGKITPEKCVW